MKNVTTILAAIALSASVLISFNQETNRGSAQTNKIDNVYLFVNSIPTVPYDTVFKFKFTAIAGVQISPPVNYYKNVVKAAYKKDEGKEFDGVIFNSNDGYHQAIKFKD
jgi:hypothetical protein